MEEVLNCRQNCMSFKLKGVPVLSLTIRWLETIRIQKILQFQIVSWNWLILDAYA